MEIEEPEVNSQALNELLNAVIQPQGPYKESTQSQEVNEAASTNIPPQASSSQLFLPEVILYSTNVLADSSLWNGRFKATSLFSTNKFLQGDILNIACSL